MHGDRQWVLCRHCKHCRVDDYVIPGRFILAGLLLIVIVIVIFIAHHHHHQKELPINLPAGSKYPSLILILMIVMITS